MTLYPTQEVLDNDVMKKPKDRLSSNKIIT